MSRLHCLVALLALATAVGCAADSSNNATGSRGISGTGGTAGVAGIGATGGFGGAAGMAGFAGAAGVGGMGTVAGRGPQGSTAVPCDVADSLALRCQSCHGAQPLAGVPMSLMSWEDFQAPLPSNPAMTVAQGVRARTHDVAAPMPPPPGTLPADELAALDAWIDGGSMAGVDPSCAPVVDPNPGFIGGSYLTSIPPFADKCYDIYAHPNGQKDAPLPVTGEDYGTFYFDAPWPSSAQGVWFETIPGENPEILHHWLVYAEENSNNADGFVEYPTAGTHPSSPTLVAGWAPGADNNDLPNDVGLQLAAANGKMSMEIHFFPSPGQQYSIRAGVRICTVETPETMRPNTATISWLGTELGINIPPMAADSTATGICTPQFPPGVEEITILRSWPHMHLLGRKMKSTIIRADGSREPMHPGDGWPFDFNNEVSHKTEFKIRPGDSVETTCHYTNNTANAVGVGFENRYEMCFNFTTAYPAKALVNKGFFGSTSLTNSSTACLY